MEVSALSDEIQSFGLEFGPNFFDAHFYGDLDGTQYVNSIRREQGAWEKAQAEISHLGMPLFGVVHTSNWTLIPTDLFTEDRAEHFLKFNTAYAGDLPAAWDRILPLDAILLYPTLAMAETFASTHYPGLGLRHAAGVLLEIVHRREASAEDTATYIHQMGHTYHVAVYKSGRLELTNFVEAPHLEDIRYYILFTQKQLDVAPSAPIYLIGQAAANDELRASLEKYCPKVQNGGFTQKAEAPALQAEQFIAINAHRCG